MKKGRLIALTMMEACMIMLLSVLVFIHYKQHQEDSVEQDVYKTTAVSAYSILNNAMPNAMNSFERRFFSEADIINYLSRKLGGVKNCSDSKKESCWSDNWMWNDRKKPGIQLSTTQYIMADFVSSDCSYDKNIPNTCAFIYIDTNGQNKPNEVGKDILLFYMTRFGFIPAGTRSDSVTKRDDCDLYKEKYNWGCTAELLGLN